MSTKSTAEKLLIKPVTAVWLSSVARRDLVGELPAGAHHVEDACAATVAVLFADDAASLRTVLDVHAPELGDCAVFWVAYPKANRTDVNRDTLWPILAGYGMRPVSQVAIDEVWSALRFRKLRPEEPPFTCGA